MIHIRNEMSYSRDQILAMLSGAMSPGMSGGASLAEYRAFAKRFKEQWDPANGSPTGIFARNALKAAWAAATRADDARPASEKLFKVPAEKKKPRITKDETIFRRLGKLVREFVEKYPIVMEEMEGEGLIGGATRAQYLEWLKSAKSSIPVADRKQAWVLEQMADTAKYGPYKPKKEVKSKAVSKEQKDIDEFNGSQIYVWYKDYNQ